MSSQNPCTACGTEMELVGEARRVFTPDPETMTEGQLAEQQAAQMGGPFEEGIHGATTRFFECPECGETAEEWA